MCKVSEKCQKPWSIGNGSMLCVANKMHFFNTIPHPLEPEVFLVHTSVQAAVVFHECTLD